VNRSTIPEPSWRPWHDDEPIRLGVSSCLLGAEVRYDGGHKRDSYLTEVLDKWFEWVPVCPELEIGLGVPRSPIQLVKNEPTPRLVEPVSSDDLTERMESFAGRRLAEIEELGLDGFILKSRSPSCGLEGVDVFDADRSSIKDGVGIFARILAEKWPGLPVAEEAWFGDDRRFRDFIERVLRNHRQRTLSRRDLHPRHLAELHAVHQLLLERLLNPV